MKEMVGGCCVCSDERGWAENPLVYCDGSGCNVAVHQACYGIITVPSGPWYCRKCESQERAARVRCEMCPQKDGALKRTDTGGWCHVVCALFIPEAWFGNVQTMEPIILKGVPPERYNKVSCYICEESNRQAKATTGGCMQCNKSGCKAYFHVTCAQQLGLLCEEAGNYDNVKYCGYCSYHFKKLKKDRFIKAIPAFKPIQGELIAHKGESPEKIYQFSDDAEVFDIKAQREKKKDSNVKQIPPFKSLAPADDTPESSPEKAHPLKLKEKRGPGGSQGGESSASPSTGSSDITSSGKFTTANFREATVTHSPANLFMFEQEKKVKNLQARKDTAHHHHHGGGDKKESVAAAKKAASQQLGSAADKKGESPAGAVKKGESTAAVKKGESPAAATVTSSTSSSKKGDSSQSNMAATASASGAPSKKETAASKKAAAAMEKEKERMEKIDKMEKSGGKASAMEKGEKGAGEKGAGGAEKGEKATGKDVASDGSAAKKEEGVKQETGDTATKSGDDKEGGTGEKRKSSSFLELANAPLFAMGTALGPAKEKQAPAEPATAPPSGVTSTGANQSHPSGSFSLSYETFLSKNAAANKDEHASPETASRKRQKTQGDSGGSEKKPKAKKQKVAATGGGGDKGGAPGGQANKGGGSKMAAKDMLTSPVLSSGPESPTPGSTPPHNKDGGEKVKVKQNRKRKDSSSHSTGPVYSSSAYARDKTLPISLSSLQKGEKGVDSPQLSPTSKLFQTDLSPAKDMMHDALGGRDINGSSAMRGLVSPPKPLSIKTSLASPKSGSDAPVGSLSTIFDPTPSDQLSPSPLLTLPLPCKPKSCTIVKDKPGSEEVKCDLAKVFQSSMEVQFESEKATKGSTTASKSNYLDQVVDKLAWVLATQEEKQPTPKKEKQSIKKRGRGRKKRTKGKGVHRRDDPGGETSEDATDGVKYKRQIEEHKHGIHKDKDEVEREIPTCSLSANPNSLSPLKRVTRSRRRRIQRSNQCPCCEATDSEEHQVQHGSKGHERGSKGHQIGSKGHQREMKGHRKGQRKANTSKQRGHQSEVNDSIFDHSRIEWDTELRNPSGIIHIPDSEDGLNTSFLEMIDNKATGSDDTESITSEMEDGINLRDSGSQLNRDMSQLDSAIQLEEVGSHLNPQRSANIRRVVDGTTTATSDNSDICSTKNSEANQSLLDYQASFDQQLGANDDAIGSADSSPLRRQARFPFSSTAKRIQGTVSQRREQPAVKIDWTPNPLQQQPRQKSLLLPRVTTSTRMSCPSMNPPRINSPGTREPLRMTVPQRMTHSFDISNRPGTTNRPRMTNPSYSQNPPAGPPLSEWFRSTGTTSLIDEARRREAVRLQPPFHNIIGPFMHQPRIGEPQLQYSQASMQNICVTPFSPPPRRIEPLTAMRTPGPAVECGSSEYNTVANAQPMGLRLFRSSSSFPSALPKSRPQRRFNRNPTPISETISVPPRLPQTERLPVPPMISTAAQKQHVQPRAAHFDIPPRSPPIEVLQSRIIGDSQPPRGPNQTPTIIAQLQRPPSVSPEKRLSRTQDRMPIRPKQPPQQAADSVCLLRPTASPVLPKIRQVCQPGIPRIRLISVQNRLTPPPNPASVIAARKPHPTLCSVQVSVPVLNRQMKPASPAMVVAAHRPQHTRCSLNPQFQPSASVQDRPTLPAVSNADTIQPSNSSINSPLQQNRPKEPMGTMSKRKIQQELRSFNPLVEPSSSVSFRPSAPLNSPPSASVNSPNKPSYSVSFRHSASINFSPAASVNMWPSASLSILPSAPMTCPTSDPAISSFTAASSPLDLSLTSMTSQFVATPPTSEIVAVPPGVIFPALPIFKVDMNTGVSNRHLNLCSEAANREVEKRPNQNHERGLHIGSGVSMQQQQQKAGAQLSKNDEYGIDSNVRRSLSKVSYNTDDTDFSAMNYMHTLLESQSVFQSKPTASQNIRNDHPIYNPNVPIGDQHASENQRRLSQAVRESAENTALLHSKPPQSSSNKQNILDTIADDSTEMFISLNDTSILSITPLKRGSVNMTSSELTENVKFTTECVKSSDNEASKCSGDTLNLYSDYIESICREIEGNSVIQNRVSISSALETEQSHQMNASTRDGAMEQIKTSINGSTDTPMEQIKPCSDLSPEQSRDLVARDHHQGHEAIDHVMSTDAEVEVDVLSFDSEEKGLTTPHKKAKIEGETYMEDQVEKEKLEKQETDGEQHDVFEKSQEVEIDILSLGAEGKAWAMAFKTQMADTAATTSEVDEKASPPIKSPKTHMKTDTYFDEGEVEDDRHEMQGADGVQHEVFENSQEAEEEIKGEKQKVQEDLREDKEKKQKVYEEEQQQTDQEEEEEWFDAAEQAKQIEEDGKELEGERNDIEQETNDEERCHFKEERNAKNAMKNERNNIEEEGNIDKERNYTEEEKNDIEEERNDLEEEKNNTEEEKNDTEEESNDTEAEKNDIVEERNGIEEEKNDTEDERNDFEEKRKEIEEERNAIEDDRNDIEVERNDMEEEKNDIEEQMNDTEEERNDTEAEKNDIEEEKNDTEEERNDTDAEKNNIEERNGIEEEKNDTEEERNDTEAEKNNIEERNGIEEEKNNTEDERNDFEEKRKEIEEERNAIEDERNDIEVERNDMEEEKNDTEAERNDVEEERNDFEEDGNEIKEESNVNEEQINKMVEVKNDIDDERNIEEGRLDIEEEKNDTEKEKNIIEENFNGINDERNKIEEERFEITFKRTDLEEMNDIEGKENDNEEESNIGKGRIEIVGERNDIDTKEELNLFEERGKEVYVSENNKSVKVDNEKQDGSQVEVEIIEVKVDGESHKETEHGHFHANDNDPDVIITQVKIGKPKRSQIQTPTEFDKDTVISKLCSNQNQKENNELLPTLDKGERIIGTIIPISTTNNLSDLASSGLQTTSTGNRIWHNDQFPVTDLELWESCPEFQPTVALDEQEFQQAKEKFLSARNTPEALSPSEESQYATPKSQRKRGRKRSQRRKRKDSTTLNVILTSTDEAQFATTAKSPNVKDGQQTPRKRKRRQSDVMGDDTLLWQHAQRRRLTRSYSRLCNQYIEDVVVKSERDQGLIRMFVDPSVVKKEVATSREKRRVLRGARRARSEQLGQQEKSGLTRSRSVEEDTQSQTVVEDNRLQNNEQETSSQTMEEELMSQTIKEEDTRPDSANSSDALCTASVIDKHAKTRQSPIQKEQIGQDPTSDSVGAKCDNKFANETSPLGQKEFEIGYDFPESADSESVRDPCIEKDFTNGKKQSDSTLDINDISNSADSNDSGQTVEDITEAVLISNESRSSKDSNGLQSVHKATLADVHKTGKTDKDEPENPDTLSDNMYISYTIPLSVELDPSENKREEMFHQLNPGIGKKAFEPPENTIENNQNDHIDTNLPEGESVSNISDILNENESHTDMLNAMESNNEIQADQKIDDMSNVESPNELQIDHKTATTTDQTILMEEESLGDMLMTSTVVNNYGFDNVLINDIPNLEAAIGDQEESQSSIPDADEYSMGKPNKETQDGLEGIKDATCCSVEPNESHSTCAKNKGDDMLNIRDNTHHDRLVEDMLTGLERDSNALIVGTPNDISRYERYHSSMPDNDGCIIETATGQKQKHDTPNENSREENEFKRLISDADECIFETVKEQEQKQGGLSEREDQNESRNSIPFAHEYMIETAQIQRQGVFSEMEDKNEPRGSTHAANEFTVDDSKQKQGLLSEMEEITGYSSGYKNVSHRSLPHADEYIFGKPNKQTSDCFEGMKEETDIAKMNNSTRTESEQGNIPNSQDNKPPEKSDENIHTDQEGNEYIIGKPNRQKQDGLEDMEEDDENQSTCAAKNEGDDNTRKRQDNPSSEKSDQNMHSDQESNSNCDENPESDSCCVFWLVPETHATLVCVEENKDIEICLDKPSHANDSIGISPANSVDEIQLSERDTTPDVDAMGENHPHVIDKADSMTENRQIDQNEWQELQWDSSSAEFDHCTFGLVSDDVSLDSDEAPSLSPVAAYQNHKDNDVLSDVTTRSDLSPPILTLEKMQNRKLSRNDVDFIGDQYIGHVPSQIDVTGGRRETAIWSIAKGDNREIQVWMHIPLQLISDDVFGNYKDVMSESEKRALTEGNIDSRLGNTIENESASTGHQSTMNTTTSEVNKNAPSDHGKIIHSPSDVSFNNSWNMGNEPVKNQGSIEQNDDVAAKEEEPTPPFKKRERRVVAARGFVMDSVMLKKSRKRKLHIQSDSEPNTQDKIHMLVMRTSGQTKKEVSPIATDETHSKPGTLTEQSKSNIVESEYSTEFQEPTKTAVLTKSFYGKGDKKTQKHSKTAPKGKASKSQVNDSSKVSQNASKVSKKRQPKHRDMSKKCKSPAASKPLLNAIKEASQKLQADKKIKLRASNKRKEDNEGLCTTKQHAAKSAYIKRPKSPKVLPKRRQVTVSRKTTQNNKRTANDKAKKSRATKPTLQQGNPKEANDEHGNVEVVKRKLTFEEILTQPDNCLPAVTAKKKPKMSHRSASEPSFRSANVLSSKSTNVLSSRSANVLSSQSTSVLSSHVIYQKRQLNTKQGAGAKKKIEFEGIGAIQEIQTQKGVPDKAVDISEHESYDISVDLRGNSDAVLQNDATKIIASNSNIDDNRAEDDVVRINLSCAKLISGPVAMLQRGETVKNYRNQHDTNIEHHAQQLIEYQTEVEDKILEHKPKLVDDTIRNQDTQEGSINEHKTEREYDINEHQAEREVNTNEHQIERVVDINEHQTQKGDSINEHQDQQVKYNKGHQIQEEHSNAHHFQNADRINEHQGPGEENINEHHPQQVNSIIEQQTEEVVNNNEHSAPEYEPTDIAKTDHDSIDDSIDISSENMSAFKHYRTRTYSKSDETERTQRQHKSASTNEGLSKAQWLDLIHPPVAVPSQNVEPETSHFVSPQQDEPREDRSMSSTPKSLNQNRNIETSHIKSHQQNESVQLSETDSYGIDKKLDRRSEPAECIADGKCDDSKAGSSLLSQNREDQLSDLPMNCNDSILLSEHPDPTTEGCLMSSTPNPKGRGRKSLNRSPNPELMLQHIDTPLKDCSVVLEDIENISNKSLRSETIQNIGDTQPKNRSIDLVDKGDMPDKSLSESPIQNKGDTPLKDCSVVLHDIWSDVIFYNHELGTQPEPPDGPVTKMTMVTKTPDNACQQMGDFLATTKTLLGELSQDITGEMCNPYFDPDKKNEGNEEAKQPVYTEIRMRVGSLQEQNESNTNPEIYESSESMNEASPRTEVSINTSQYVSKPARVDDFNVSAIPQSTSKPLSVDVTFENANNTQLSALSPLSPVSAATIAAQCSPHNTKPLNELLNLTLTAINQLSEVVAGEALSPFHSQDPIAAESRRDQEAFSSFKQKDATEVSRVEATTDYVRPFYPKDAKADSREDETKDVTDKDSVGDGEEEMGDDYKQPQYTQFRMRVGSLGDLNSSHETIAGVMMTGEEDFSEIGNEVFSSGSDIAKQEVDFRGTGNAVFSSGSDEIPEVENVEAGVTLIQPHVVAHASLNKGQIENSGTTDSRLHVERTIDASLFSDLENIITNLDQANLDEPVNRELLTTNTNVDIAVKPKKDTAHMIGADQKPPSKTRIRRPKNKSHLNIAYESSVNGNNDKETSTTECNVCQQPPHNFVNPGCPQHGITPSPRKRLKSENSPQVSSALTPNPSLPPISAFLQDICEIRCLM